ncbi:unnamed protein product [Adineta ricciae]|uniref:Uncharacterized protein n=1 Tax=Adineta ricciae TaxID=249248 RepID=A0A815Q8D7_ADIRI|nr:unnamed protein product [Adineta ricciae]CAF1624996.1 unnamed protein product [Adineta ricciae]
MDKSLSYHQYYQIVPPTVHATKYRSKSSESLPSHHLQPTILFEQHQQHLNRKAKVKKSNTALIDFQVKPSANTSSVLRRRFSLFRAKRCHQSDEQADIQTLQQTIDQLKQDLLIKTNELEGMKELIENKRNTMRHTPGDSIEQAMRLQLILHARLEEMLRENELLKKTICDLETFAQQQKSKI